MQYIYNIYNTYVLIKYINEYKGIQVSRWEEEDAAERKSLHPIKETNLLNYDVDEFAADVSNLKLYRPNMGMLTSKDILRLKRLHKVSIYQLLLYI